MSRVTVLVAAYNAEKYLEACLDSLVNQTLKDIQIVCIDDASTDSTPAILQKYADKDSRIPVKGDFPFRFQLRNKKPHQRHCDPVENSAHCFISFRKYSMSAAV